MSLRRELSLVLLLSAFSTVVLVALTVVLFSGLAGGPAQRSAAAGAALAAIEARLMAPMFDDDAAEAVLAAITDLGEAAAGLPEAAAEPLPAFHAATVEWLAMRQAAPELPPVVDGVRRRAYLETRVRLVGALAYGVQRAKPVWVVAVMPWLPWGAAWVLLVAGIGVWRAWHLKAQFSVPLEALSAAAARVGAGALGTEMPVVQSVGEIAVLRDSFEAARRRLVGSIAALDVRRAELSKILEHMTDGVLLVDSKGALRTFNACVRRLWEAAGSEGRPPADGRALSEVFPRLLGVGVTPTQVSLGSDEAPLVVRVAANVLPGGDRVMVLHDVTREHELEAMERTFLSMVTHELKTPLTSIGGYTRLLLRGKGGALEPRGESFVQIIDQESRKLQHMIQDLLDISRLEAGSFPVDRRPIEVAALVERVQQSYVGAAEAGGHQLVVDVDVGAVQMLADPIRIEQVLGNLIGNGLKFTPQGGTVTLRAWTEAGEAGAVVRFAVEDTGRGIPPGALRHLFEKFFQVDREDTRNVGGAGLGLYICRELVHAHDGTIEVQSTVGVGTRFDLTFGVEPEGTMHGAA